MSRGWDESEHPRWPAGSGDRSGEFREKTGGWVAAVATAIRSPEQELRDLVSRAEVVRQSELSGGAVADTQVHTLRDTDGSRHFVVRKRYNEWGKPAVAREALVAQIARVIGAPVPTTIADWDSLERGWPTLYMDYIEGETPLRMAQLQAGTPPYSDVGATLDGIFESAAESPDAGRLGLLDLLIYNQDRNDGNWLITPGGGLAGIDHSSVDLEWDEESKAFGTRQQYWSGEGRFSSRFVDHNLELTDIDVITPAEAVQMGVAMTIIADSFDPGRPPREVDLTEAPREVLIQAAAAGSREAAGELARRVRERR